MLADDGSNSALGPEVVMRKPQAGVGWVALSIGIMGLALGVLELTIGIPRADPADHLLLVHVLVGWTFVGSSLLALTQHPGHRVGYLLAAVGVLWFVPLLTFFDSSTAFSIGFVAEGLFWAPLAQLFLTFPSGRLLNRLDRIITSALYLLLPLFNLLIAFFVDFQTAGCVTCPANLFLISHDMRVAETIATVDSAVGGLIAVAVILRFAWRWRETSGAARRAMQPVMWGIVPGAVAAAYFVVTPLVETSPELERAALPLLNLALIGLPVGFLVGLLRSQLDRSLVGDLLVELKGAMPHGRLRQSLAKALGDPTLELAFWLPEPARYVDEEGLTVTIPEAGPRRVTPIDDSQREPLAVLVHDPAVLQDTQRVEAVASAARLALENERLHAELRAQLEEVRASRMRVVAAGDEARRRLERDLHDGAQQRLLAISAAVERARSIDAASQRRAELMAEIANELKETLAELRDLARGIHPALLTDEGLGPAIESLARRAQIPTRIEASSVERLPRPVEATVYYVIAEAIANAVRHSGATEVTVATRREARELLVSVRDDGQGGAVVGEGSGLRGLQDRVVALGGSLQIDSPLGEGTVVTAHIPVRLAGP